MKCDCYPAAAAARVVDVLRSQQVSCIKCELVKVPATDTQAGVKMHNPLQQHWSVLITMANLMRIMA